MSRKFFGTDGIRGKANSEPMTAETAMRVAMAAGLHFRNGHHQTVVIGKDTRLSGYMLEPAMTAGFVSMGMDVVLVGPMPTPAVAMLTRSLRADLGVVISASHNPFEDNGIKLFGADGYKLSDEVELEIEAKMDSAADHRASAAGLGAARRMDDARGRYVEFVKASFPRGMRLDDLKIVIDCAHGAAYRVAPDVLWELGAEVVRTGVSPNGRNINDQCGATHPDAVAEAVVKHGADVGIALDGDADRLQMVDEKGNKIDGDQVMGLVAGRWQKDGRLRGDGIVSTVMSNLGLERYLQSLGLRLDRTRVGDRYVVERMRELEWNVGGEQSGHVVLSDYATTGDGLTAALQVLSCLVDANRPASEVLRIFAPLPQIMRNVRVEGTCPMDRIEVRSAVADGEARLARSGRLLIRKSGTEPLIRVMAEGEDEVLVTAVVNDVADAIQRAAD
ncbi:MAG: phosphoglucosamine mutase [Alphaproteobacteria bacterium]